MNMIALLKEISATFVEMAPYLLLGLTFAGILHVLIGKRFIARHFGKKSVGSVVKAAILGVPLPLCSCGVLPTALSLRKAKASEGATMSFLISTPQTGIDSFVATYGLLGPIFAIFRPFAALVIGIFGGITINLFPSRHKPKEPDGKSQFQCSICYIQTPHTHSFKERVISIFQYAFGDFLDDISVQLIVGIVISGCIAYFVPDDFFLRYGGDTIFSMLFMIVAGIPLYVCATASIPIAVALMMKGLSPGAAFVFLAVGPATNAASITLISKSLGKRFVTVYIAVIAVASIFFGYVLNWIHRFLGIGIAEIQQELSETETGSVWMLSFSVVFSLLLLFSLLRKYFPSSWARILHLFSSRRHSHAAYSPGDSVYTIEGMTCNHCARRVSEAIYSVEGVERVDIDIAGRTAKVHGRFEPRAVEVSIRNAGFLPVGVQG
jgi:hypothetical protein